MVKIIFKEIVYGILKGFFEQGGRKKKHIFIDGLLYDIFAEPYDESFAADFCLYISYEQRTKQHSKDFQHPIALKGERCYYSTLLGGICINKLRRDQVCTCTDFRGNEFFQPAQCG
jgi:hypothetical protein